MLMKMFLEGVSDYMPTGLSGVTWDLTLSAIVGIVGGCLLHLHVIVTITVFFTAFLNSVTRGVSLFFCLPQ